MSDGKEVLVKWDDDENDSKKIIKNFIKDFKENNIDELIIIGLVQKFLQNSNIRLTREEIIELL